MRTQSAPVIKLSNYTPPAYAIETVDMTVRLDPAKTRIETRSMIRRQRGTKPTVPLLLDGDELVLVSAAIDGRPVAEKYLQVTPQSLELRNLPKAKTFELEIVTEVAPASNSKLMGLYQSNGVYCTQCEAEGFRRITYFLDRPDVLATYTVRLEADRDDCPLLLSNGNPVKKGKLSGNRHFAVWHDPHPKPCYLFAMVGGKLDALSDKFTTASGRKVALNIYVEKGKANLAEYAMGALKRSMVWDEEAYGREYDLDVFNIVAVSDFNMGAMENKGLNVFNDKYILADPNTATDTDFMYIEAIIAHEYFHNWTGNRITCRDWFQLCLKEGLTVYRDQEFSSDIRSRPVQRIQQVRVLKSMQFPEDAGPLAHSVRPSAYREINNFYTATVYQKGAEVVRMLATLVGPKAYRKSTDLYFKRHDGEAAVVEDWLKSFEDAAKIDLSQFAQWYAQAGTPVVEVGQSYDAKKKRYTLTLAQSVPETPGQKRKKAVPIPIRFGLLDNRGIDLKVSTKSAAVRGDVILLDKAKMSIVFEGVDAKPVPSLLRGFSAPVTLNFKESEAARIFRARHDSDAYNRWEALNGLATQLLIKSAKATGRPMKIEVDARFVSAIVDTAFDDTLDPAFRAEVLSLPKVQDVARTMGRNVDPDAIAKARTIMLSAIGKALGEDGFKLAAKLKKKEAKVGGAEAAALRALKNSLLPLLAAGGIEGAVDVAEKQFNGAKNMTDRLAGLNVLLHNQSDTKRSDAALERFYKKFRKNPLVIDKWFAAQAMFEGKQGLACVKKLTRHPDFSLNNPNRARSLLGTFAAGNMTGFHRADGKAYAFYADQILKFDKINPQVAARMLTLMNNWRMFERKRQAGAKSALQKIAKSAGLSRDVQEIVDRMLG